jgi:hypothetical protein
MKRFLAVGAVITAALAVHGDTKKCECTHWPWTDGCEKVCVAQVLVHAERGTLKDKLFVSDKILDKVASAKSHSGNDAAGFLMDTLTEDETTSAVKAIGDLGKKERAAFVEGKSIKKEM